MRIKKRILGASCESGFTLVELLMVISIIIVLLALILPTLQGSSDKRNAAAIMKTVENISSGLIRYKADLGSYPAALQLLWDKSVMPSTVTDYWKGPYMDTPSKTTGTAPAIDVADQFVAGVTYHYVKLTGSGGGTGNCANCTQVGANNPTGADHTVQVLSVPHDTAKAIKDQMGNRVCLSDGNADTTDIYFIVEETW